jgi:antagonist of KipI
MISVLHAPAYCTVQDQGWSDKRRSGMPVSGAMDQWALSAANQMVGNPLPAAALEWGLTGGRLHFERDATVAICGPGMAITHPVRAGEELALPRPTEGRFLYLAVAGGLDVPVILGRRSTYLPAGFGHLIKTGERLPIGSDRVGSPASPRGKPDYASGLARVVEGPQRHLFSDERWTRFLATPWTVSRASDRMGYRLEGETPIETPPADLPSEGTCVGAVQVPPDGMPIVLMADGPTVGGYPKIAVVISADVPIVAQRQPGEVIRFEETTVSEAQRALRAAAGPAF